MNNLGILFISVSWTFILFLAGFSFAKMFAGEKKQPKKSKKK